MITEGQVRTAIVDEKLRLDDDILDELEQSIEAAFWELPGGSITCDLEIQPLTASA